MVLPNAPGWRPDEKATTIREAWALFALPPGEERPELGIVSLHLVIWKYIVYNLTLAETEGKAFETRHVWRAAWKCFKSKVDAKSIVLRRLVQRSESRGENVPDLTKYLYNRLTEPFALSMRVDTQCLTKRSRPVWPLSAPIAQQETKAR